ENSTRLRRTRNLIVNNSRSFDLIINSNQFCTNNSVTSSNIFAEPGQMENNDRTLKEMATPDVVYQSWCIQYPQLKPAQTYKLKSGLIHLLPKFHGLAREDPHKHLKEFHMVCSTMRPQGILEDYIKMKVFPFTLDGAAKDWLYLQPVLFNTWRDMNRTFLEKFFLASRTVSIKKEICGIRQHARETLHEYWERFNKLCATCPHHQISEQLLIQYFYERLSMMDRSMIDAASGGALMDKMTTAARHLISNMASNTQYVVTLRSGKELPQPTLQKLLRPAKVDSEPNANSQPRPKRVVLFHFHLGPSRQGSQSQTKNC
ncbi:hypothetical protein CR513_12057, partial [Mucuna pruriens]